MDVHDAFVPEELFGAFIAEMPQVCVELVLETDDGVLVARRSNPPAKGRWFWPGSRLYKGEELEAAARRVGREELGVAVAVEEQLGVAAHFWDETRVPSAASRHTVNIVFRGRLLDAPAEIVLDDQHESYRFLSAREPGLHEYVTQYLDEFALV